MSPDPREDPDDDVWLDDEEPDADDDQPVLDRPDEVSDDFSHDWWGGDDSGE